MSCFSGICMTIVSCFCGVLCYSSFLWQGARHLLQICDRGYMMTKCALPWYNCTGWLGIKHQLTYLRDGSIWRHSHLQRIVACKRTRLYLDKCWSTALTAPWVWLVHAVLWVWLVHSALWTWLVHTAPWAWLVHTQHCEHDLYTLHC